MSGRETLESGRVVVWHSSLQPPAARLAALRDHLNEDERERAQRRIIESKRTECIVSRGTLREVLSRYIDAVPGELRFDYGEHGKPYLRGERISFNVSHSGNTLLIAVTTNEEVGIDVERVRSDLAHEKVARRFFSPAEVEELSSLDAALRPRAFFRCWTLKEAFVKVKGVGLALPLDQFDVTVAPDGPVALLGTRPDEEERERWALSDLPVDGDYFAALAVESRDVEVEHRRIGA